MADGNAMSSPASLFIELWQKLERLSATQRTRAMPPDGMFANVCDELLRADDGAEAANNLKMLIEHSAKSVGQLRGRQLHAMYAIDRAFLAIHPRSLRTLSGGAVVSPPAWLVSLRHTRFESGAYLSDGPRRLLPRGPLLRSPRGEAASSAESLPDRFSALALAPVAFEHEGRRINVNVKVIGCSADCGVEPPEIQGEETVGFVPVAEAVDDIQAEAVERNGSCFISFQLNFAPDERISNALLGMPRVDVLLAPELILTEAAADRLSETFLADPVGKPNLTISGSYVTAASDDGQGWNESRVINAFGSEIWRQRKIWPAGITRQRAIEFGILVPPDEGLIYEDTASGDDMVIADLDGLGRCIVFICQDIQAAPLAAELIRTYQPDWIYCPILDRGVAEGRWAHQRAFALSDITQSRFLAVSSSSFARRMGLAEPIDVAIAVGPRDPAENEDTPRAFKIVDAGDGSASGWARLTWRASDWVSTTVASI